MRTVLDVQQTRCVEVDNAREPARQLRADVLIVGGGLGGVAAASAAADAGCSVILTDETDWLGGQATSQGVSALDENRYIESSGGTRSYLAFRAGIRDWYRRNAKLKPDAAANERLNPGRGWVSRLCFEPKAALAVIDEMLQPHVDEGRLQILMRRKACAVSKSAGRIQHVDVVELDSRERTRLVGDCLIDASELGDLLALGAADFVVGAESKRRTDEPTAADTDDPEDVQSFTVPFAIEHRPGERHPIAKPSDYDRNVREQPYTLTLEYAERGSIRYGIFDKLERTPGSFWTYRRLIDASQFDDPAYPNDIAMINWPGNDYRGGSILTGDPQQQVEHLQAARNLSLGLMYWLHHDVQRDDGEGRGYPEFKLRRDVMSDDDGLAKFPYIRESRRIVALKTILEHEITTDGPRARHFDDSVGIGLYAIDLHESKRNRKQIIRPAKPFQIPLGALIPQGCTNLLAGAKNIGTTHITNGCYRLHPIEWNIGEAAGRTAALSVTLRTTVPAIRDDAGCLRLLQSSLIERGVPLMWYDDLPVTDPRFPAAQMLPFECPDTLDRLQANLRAP